MTMNLISTAGYSNINPKIKMESCKDVAADVSVMSDFKKMISLLSRTRVGHARFRRAPPSTATTMSSSSPSSSLEQITQETTNEQKELTISKLSPLPPLTRTISFTSQPLSSLKRKCFSSKDSINVKCTSVGSSGGCNCSKRRKPGVKKVVKIPIISLKMAEIPSDDFSWRKYGQKSIQGSPHPRGYYRCSSVKNCPARKQVERARNEEKMLIVTYEGEHNHSKAVVTETITINILESS